MRYRALHGVSSNISGVLASAEAILADPALPVVTKSIIELRDLENKGGTGESGIGLKRIVKPLQLYVRVRKTPILGVAIVAGLLSVPFLLGYGIGKRRGKAK